MTLDDLAILSGLTPNYIGSIELGHRDISLSTILSLARGLDVHPGELFPSAEGLSPMIDEAARLFDRVAPRLQASVIGLLRAVVTKAPREPPTES